MASTKTVVASAGAGILAIIALGAAYFATGGGGSQRATPSELSVSASGWRTDFAKHTVPLDEFDSGGPPRDGIPPIDKPRFTVLAEAEEWLADREPVVAVSIGDEARAYPIQILIWHEIVNDRFDSLPVAVTFCPLCNSTLVFDRRVDGEPLRFGTTGNLRKSDLVMWDDATESWWQQFTGEAIVGELAGTRLHILNSQMLAWGDFKARYPAGRVLARPANSGRPYGENPYAGYDDVKSPPFALRSQDLDGRLLPKERVSTIRVGAERIAIPMRLLRRAGIAQATVGKTPIVAFFKPGLSSALDEERIAGGRDTGTAAAFDRRVAGRKLDFDSRRSGRFVDRRTRSAWDITGRAVAGPLRGEQLVPVGHDEQFWFAVAAFAPDIEILRKARND